MKLIFSILIAASYCLSLSLFADDLEAGKTLAQKSCAVCHGLDGQATVPLAAHISGQQKDYLIIQLRAYKSGKRQHEQMSIIAKPLTNEQIDQLAEWYSNIKVTIEAPQQLDTKQQSSDVPERANKENAIEDSKTQDVEDNIVDIDPDIIQSIQESIKVFIQ